MTAYLKSHDKLEDVKLTKLDFFFEKWNDINWDKTLKMERVLEPLSQLSDETLIKKYFEYLTSKRLKGLDKDVILKVIFSKYGWNESTLINLVNKGFI